LLLPGGDPPFPFDWPSLPVVGSLVGESDHGWFPVPSSCGG
jgi:hypothetical protein